MKLNNESDTIGQIMHLNNKQEKKWSEEWSDLLSLASMLTKDRTGFIACMYQRKRKVNERESCS